MTTLIRPESAADSIGIRRLLEAAFDTPAEACLVEALRSKANPYISLVAMAAGRTVGNIVFTPVRLDADSGGARVAGLAPLAVLPERQRQGIGGRLIEEGIARCWVASFDAIVVLGHPEYYPRFGFKPAHEFGLECEFEAPPEAFMALELRTGALNEAAGVTRFHPAFSEIS